MISGTFEPISHIAGLGFFTTAPVLTDTIETIPRNYRVLVFGKLALVPLHGGFSQVEVLIRVHT